jgi:predicted DNA-binding protein (MmcQ/YjbR family)
MVMSQILTALPLQDRYLWFCGKTKGTARVTWCQQVQQMQMMPFVFMRNCITHVRASAKGLVHCPPPGQHARMTRQTVNQHCVTLPGAMVSDPWGGGHDAWKVGGKLFACIGVMGDGVSVKCADVDQAAFLIDMGRATRAPYFHRSWVLVGWDVPLDELCDRLTTSYTLIRAGLPKRVQATL